MVGISEIDTSRQTQHNVRFREVHDAEEYNLAVRQLVLTLDESCFLREIMGFHTNQLCFTTRGNLGSVDGVVVDTPN